MRSRIFIFLFAWGICGLGLFFLDTQSVYAQPVVAPDAQEQQQVNQGPALPQRENFIDLGYEYSQDDESVQQSNNAQNTKNFSQWKLYGELFYDFLALQGNMNFYEFIEDNSTEKSRYYTNSSFFLGEIFAGGWSLRLVAENAPQTYSLSRNNTLTFETVEEVTKIDQIITRAITENQEWRIIGSLLNEVGEYRIFDQDAGEETWTSSSSSYTFGVEKVAHSKNEGSFYELTLRRLLGTSAEQYSLNGTIQNFLVGYAFSEGNHISYQVETTTTTTEGCCTSSSNSFAKQVSLNTSTLNFEYALSEAWGVSFELETVNDSIIIQNLSNHLFSSDSVTLGLKSSDTGLKFELGTVQSSRDLQIDSKYQSSNPPHFYQKNDRVEFKVSYKLDL